MRRKKKRRRRMGNLEGKHGRGGRYGSVYRQEEGAARWGEEMAGNALVIMQFWHGRGGRGKEKEKGRKTKEDRDRRE